MGNTGRVFGFFSMELFNVTTILLIICFFQMNFSFQYYDKNLSIEDWTKKQIKALPTPFPGLKYSGRQYIHEDDRVVAIKPMFPETSNGMYYKNHQSDIRPVLKWNFFSFPTHQIEKRCLPRKLDIRRPINLPPRILHFKKPVYLPPTPNLGMPAQNSQPSYMPENSVRSEQDELLEGPLNKNNQSGKLSKLKQLIEYLRKKLQSKLGKGAKVSYIPTKPQTQVFSPDYNKIYSDENQHNAFENPSGVQEYESNEGTHQMDQNINYDGKFSQDSSFRVNENIQTSAYNSPEVNTVHEKNSLPSDVFESNLGASQNLENNFDNISSLEKNEVMYKEDHQAESLYDHDTETLHSDNSKINANIVINIKNFNPYINGNGLAMSMNTEENLKEKEMNEKSSSEGKPISGETSPMDKLAILGISKEQIHASIKDYVHQYMSQESSSTNDFIKNKFSKEDQRSEDDKKLTFTNETQKIGSNEYENKFHKEEYDKGHSKETSNVNYSNKEASQQMEIPIQEGTKPDITYEDVPLPRNKTEENVSEKYEGNKNPISGMVQPSLKDYGKDEKRVTLQPKLTLNSKNESNNKSNVANFITETQKLRYNDGNKSVYIIENFNDDISTETTTQNHGFELDEKNLSSQSTIKSELPEKDGDAINAEKKEKVSDLGAKNISRPLVVSSDESNTEYDFYDDASFSGSINGKNSSGKSKDTADFTKGNKSSEIVLSPDTSEEYVDFYEDKSYNHVKNSGGGISASNTKQTEDSRTKTAHSQPFTTPDYNSYTPTKYSENASSPEKERYKTDYSDENKTSKMVAFQDIPKNVIDYFETKGLGDSKNLSVENNGKILTFSAQLKTNDAIKEYNGTREVLSLENKEKTPDFGDKNSPSKSIESFDMLEDNVNFDYLEKYSVSKNYTESPRSEGKQNVSKKHESHISSSYSEKNNLQEDENIKKGADISTINNNGKIPELGVINEYDPTALNGTSKNIPSLYGSAGSNSFSINGVSQKGVNKYSEMNGTKQLSDLRSKNNKELLKETKEIKFKKYGQESKNTSKIPIEILQGLKERNYEKDRSNFTGNILDDLSIKEDGLRKEDFIINSDSRISSAQTPDLVMKNNLSSLSSHDSATTLKFSVKPDKNNILIVKSPNSMETENFESNYSSPSFQDSIHHNHNNEFTKTPEISHDYSQHRDELSSIGLENIKDFSTESITYIDSATKTKSNISLNPSQYTNDNNVNNGERAQITNNEEVTSWRKKEESSGNNMKSKTVNESLELVNKKINTTSDKDVQVGEKLQLDMHFNNSLNINDVNSTRDNEKLEDQLTKKLYDNRLSTDSYAGTQAQFHDSKKNSSNKLKFFSETIPSKLRELFKKLKENISTQKEYERNENEPSTPIVSSISIKNEDNNVDDSYSKISDRGNPLNTFNITSKPKSLDFDGGRPEENITANSVIKVGDSMSSNKYQDNERSLGNPVLIINSENNSTDHLGTHYKSRHSSSRPLSTDFNSSKLNNSKHDHSILNLFTTSVIFTKLSSELRTSTEPSNKYIKSGLENFGRNSALESTYPPENYALFNFSTFESNSTTMLPTNYNMPSIASTSMNLSVTNSYKNDMQQEAHNNDLIAGSGQKNIYTKIIDHKTPSEHPVQETKAFYSQPLEKSDRKVIMKNVSGSSQNLEFLNEKFPVYKENKSVSGNHERINTNEKGNLFSSVRDESILEHDTMANRRLNISDFLDRENNSNNPLGKQINPQKPNMEHAKKSSAMTLGDNMEGKTRDFDEIAADKNSLSISDIYRQDTQTKQTNLPGLISTANKVIVSGLNASFPTTIQSTSVTDESFRMNGEYLPVDNVSFQSFKDEFMSENPSNMYDTIWQNIKLKYSPENSNTAVLGTSKINDNFSPLQSEMTTLNSFSKLHHTLKKIDRERTVTDQDTITQSSVPNLSTSDGQMERSSLAFSKEVSSNTEILHDDKNSSTTTHFSTVISPRLLGNTLSQFSPTPKFQKTKTTKSSFKSQDKNSMEKKGNTMPISPGTGKNTPLYKKLLSWHTELQKDRKLSDKHHSLENSLLHSDYDADYYDEYEDEDKSLNDGYNEYSMGESDYETSHRSSEDLSINKNERNTENLEGSKEKVENGYDKSCIYEIDSENEYFDDFKITKETFTDLDDVNSNDSTSEEKSLLGETEEMLDEEHNKSIDNDKNIGNQSSESCQEQDLYQGLQLTTAEFKDALMGKYISDDHLKTNLYSSEEHSSNLISSKIEFPKAIYENERANPKYSIASISKSEQDTDPNNIFRIDLHQHQDNYYDIPIKKENGDMVGGPFSAEPLLDYMKIMRKPEKYLTQNRYSTIPSYQVLNTIDNQTLKKAKTKALISSLTKIKDNYRNEVEHALSEDCQCYYHGCDELCELYVSERLKSIISIIKWLQDNMDHE